MTLAYVEAAECISEPVNREPPSREAQLLTLQNTSEFDVLVIGGGATGCGCALDAVTRGKVLRWMNVTHIKKASSFFPRVRTQWAFCASTHVSLWLLTFHLQFCLM